MHGFRQAALMRDRSMSPLWHNYTFCEELWPADLVHTVAIAAIKPHVAEIKSHWRFNLIPSSFSESPSEYSTCGQKKRFSNFQEFGYGYTLLK